MYKIKICESFSDFEKAKKITYDYIDWLNINLAFQNVDDELEILKICTLSRKDVF